MRVSFVVAMSENRVIGRDGSLPWHLPRDLKHFKELTLGKNILMGRKTFLSLTKPLPHRNNLVLTRDPSFSCNNVQVFHSKDEVLKQDFVELMVIGGQEIFSLFIEECTTIYLTVIHAHIDGDTYFPEIKGFTEIKRETFAPDERNPYAYSFCQLLRDP